MEVNKDMKELQNLEQVQGEKKPSSSKTSKPTTSKTKKLTDEEKQKQKDKLALQKAKEKEKAKLALQKAKEKEKAKLALQKAKEKEKAKLALQEVKEKDNASLSGQQTVKKTTPKPKSEVLEEKVQHPIVFNPEKVTAVNKFISKDSPLENDDKTIVSNLEQLREKIRAQKQLEKDLMEKEAILIQNKDRSIQNKLESIGGISDEDSLDYDEDELEDERQKVYDLQEKVDQLNEVITKLLNIRVKDISVIDGDTYELSESFVKSNRLFEIKKENEVKLNTKVEKELENIKYDHEKAIKNLSAAEDLYDKQVEVINSLNEQLTKLSLEVNKEKSKTKEFAIQVDGLTKQLLQLNKENNLLYSQVQESLKTNEKFEHLVNANKRDYEQKIANLENLYKNEIKSRAHAEEQLELLSSVKTSLLQEITYLNDNFEQLKAKEKEQNHSFEQMAIEKVKLVEELEDVKAEKSRLEQNIETINNNIYQIKKKEEMISKRLEEETISKKRAVEELEQLKEENINLVEEIDELKLTIVKLEDQNTVLNKKLDDELKYKKITNEELEQLKDENLYILKMVDQLNKELENLQVKEKDYIIKLDEASTSKALVIHELENFQKQNLSLQSIVENLNKTIEQLKQKEEELVKRLDEEIISKTLSIQEYDLFKTKEQEYSYNLENEKNNNAKLVEELNFIKIEKEDLTKTVEEMKKVNEELTIREKSLQELNQESNLIIQELRKESIDLTTKLGELENEDSTLYQQLLNDFENLKIEKDTILNSNEDSNSKYEFLLQKNQELEELIESEIKSKNEAIEEINHLNLLLSSINENSSKYEELMNKNVELQEATDIETQIKKDLLEEVEQVKQENIKLQNIIGELNRTAEFLKVKEQESLKLQQIAELEKAQLKKELESFRDDRPRADFPYYDTFYRPSYVQRPMYQDDKDPYISEIRKLRAEIDQIRKEMAPEPITLIKEYREELNRNREQLKTISIEKDKQLQDITVSYENKLQAKEEEKATLIQEKDESMRIIEILEDQIKTKDGLIHKMKSEIKEVTEEDIEDPDFKRKIRVIRDMKKELFNRANQEEEVYSNSVKLIQEKIDIKQSDINRINRKIKELEEQFINSNDFSTANKDAFEKAKTKALIELQLQEERLSELESDITRVKNKYKAFANSKENQLNNLENKEEQTTDFYMKKVQNNLNQNENYKEIKQTEMERDQLVKQLNELKAFQSEEVEGPYKEQIINEKLAQNREQIKNRIRILENDIKVKTTEYNEYYRKISELKTELDKRIDYEKKLRTTEDNVYEYVTNKMYLNDCLTDYQNKRSLIEEKHSRVEVISHNPDLRSELLKLKGEIQHLEVFRDDLRSKIDFSKKTLKELEEKDVVKKYNTLIIHIDKIKNAQKEQREKAEVLKEDVHYKTKELETLRSKLG